jgi:hypothetical protein
VNQTPQTIASRIALAAAHLSVYPKSGIPEFTTELPSLEWIKEPEKTAPAKHPSGCLSPVVKGSYSMSHIGFLSSWLKSKTLEMTRIGGRIGRFVSRQITGR